MPLLRRSICGVRLWESTRARNTHRRPHTSAYNWLPTDESLGSRSLAHCSLEHGSGGREAKTTTRNNTLGSRRCAPHAFARRVKRGEAGERRTCRAKASRCCSPRESMLAQSVFKSKPLAPGPVPLLRSPSRCTFLSASSSSASVGIGLPGSAPAFAVLLSLLLLEVPVPRSSVSACLQKREHECFCTMWGQAEAECSV